VKQSAKGIEESAYLKAQSVTVFSITKNEARSALQIISEAIHSIVRPSESIEGICRDPDDDAILTCALGAGADYLVTGDLDLLQLKIFKGIRIVTPRDFELLFND
jgi:putative PIN family toxin of toxin-antitoxin system